MRLVISVRRPDGGRKKYVTVLTQDFPDAIDVGVTPHNFDTKPEEYRVKVVTKSKVSSFLADRTRVHLFYNQPKPKFQIINPSNLDELTVCEDCGHKVSSHGPNGCEVERGDGYRAGSDVLEALGPCGCQTVTQEAA